MARRGIEEKPEWRSVPVTVRRSVETVLGGRVARAARAWGGYGPSPTFRLLLDDGRRAFFKGVSPQSNLFQHSAHRSELRIYLELGHLISPWAPEMLGEFDAADWRVMLLEDLGPKSAPPWSASMVRRVVAGLAELHLSTSGVSLPAWLPRQQESGFISVQLWKPDMPSEQLEALAGLAGSEKAQARRWLHEFAPVLAESASKLVEPDAPLSLVHLDVRSDNLRWHNGRLRLFDWPHAGAGPPEFDAAAFAQTVTVEGGPPAEAVMRWYGGHNAVRQDMLTAAVAAISGFFAANSWQPDIPGLPRLRSFQRAQLRVTLNWAAERLGLPAPAWTDAISVS